MELTLDIRRPSGAMRIATSMKKLHYVLHAPQGNAPAFDLLFTMIERRGSRPLSLIQLFKLEI